MSRGLWRALKYTAGGTALAGAAGYAGLALHEQRTEERDRQLAAEVSLRPTPSRGQMLGSLGQSSREQPYDVLVIGGGATGTGCALDAATRGLRCALVEREDFGAQTSSRSTKLVHGGVRYLEKAVLQADAGQLRLVLEALRERRRLLDNAPHLAHELPIATPCYRWWEVPYFLAGLKAYDLLAGRHGLTPATYVTAATSLRDFSALASRGPDGSALKGTVVYHDGQFDDARLNVALAVTAARAGADALNYCEAVGLVREEGRVVGAEVRDLRGGATHTVFARQVINATGPFSDGVRQLSSPDAPRMIEAASGAHVTLPGYFTREGRGLVVPRTADGRVVFMLPWQGATIAGTTDTAAAVSANPRPTEEEVAFILATLRPHLGLALRRADVRAAWSGLRPLARDPNRGDGGGDTQSLSRDHVVTTDPDGLITVTGGKWTTYRRMAQDTLDAAVATGRLGAAGPCRTARLPLAGGDSGPLRGLPARLQQHCVLPGGAPLADDIAEHLAGAYGDRAPEVLRLAEARGLAGRLAPPHPVIAAEAAWAVRHELCQTPLDFLARRSRLAFLDAAAAAAALPEVARLVEEEHVQLEGGSWAARWRWWRRRGPDLTAARAVLATFAPLPEPSPASVQSAKATDALSQPA